MTHSVAMEDIKAIQNDTVLNVRYDGRDNPVFAIEEKTDPSITVVVNEDQIDIR